MVVKLVCWSCSAHLDVVLPWKPGSGFEVAQVALDAGWHPVMDGNRQRTLLFCRKSHSDSQLTKSGHIRLHARPSLNTNEEDSGDSVENAQCP